MVEEKVLDSAFLEKQYLFRRKVFTLLGKAFHVYEDSKASGLTHRVAWKQGILGLFKRIL